MPDHPLGEQFFLLAVLAVVAVLAFSAVIYLFLSSDPRPKTLSSDPEP
jgi:hypothetical protein